MKVKIKSCYWTNNTLKLHTQLSIKISVKFIHDENLTEIFIDTCVSSLSVLLVQSQL